MPFLTPLYEIRCTVCHVIMSYDSQFKGDEKEGLHQLSFACENEDCSEYGVSKYSEVKMTVTEESKV